MSIIEYAAAQLRWRANARLCALLAGCAAVGVAVSGVPVLPWVNDAATTVATSIAAMVRLAATDANPPQQNTMNTGVELPRATAVKTVRDGKPVLFPANEVHCLAHVLYHDGASASPEAKAGIAQVLLNRVTAVKSVTGLCAQAFRGQGRPHGCLFRRSCQSMGQVPQDIYRWDDALNFSYQFLRGEIAVPEVAVQATHFHGRTERPPWRTSTTKVGDVGNVTFLANNDTAFAVHLTTGAVVVDPPLVEPPPAAPKPAKAPAAAPRKPKTESGDQPSAFEQVMQGSR